MTIWQKIKHYPKTSLVILADIVLTGLAAVALAGQLGILVRHFSQEIMPVCLMAIFLVLSGLYRSSLNNHHALQENGI